jgi:PAS domain S-box-containing protein
MTSIVELKKERERFELVIKGISVGIWDWMDINLSEEYWSPKFYHLLGYEDKEIPANHETFKNFIHPEDKKRTFQAIENHFKKDIPFNIRYRLKIKSGSYRWFNGSATLSRDENGNPLRMVGSIQDISSLVEHEQRLSETIKKLKTSNQDLEKFTYIASHDLQEPLRTISSFVEIIQSKIDEKEDEELSEVIMYISSATQKMRQQIIDILDYSRLNVKVNINEEVDLSLLINNVKENLSYLISTKTAEIIYDDLNIKIRGNKSLLSVLFTSLITNAIKFSIEKPIVTISLEQLDDSITIAVKDNGIGIEDKFKHKIFGLFERLHSYDQYPGTGIGLPICKKIVKLHSGQMWFESEANKGTTFFFTLSQ